MRFTLLLLTALVPSLVSAQQPPGPAVAGETITTSGAGIVQAVPDRAWITISAESRAPGAREAQQRNTRAMTPVIDSLKGAGIPAEAIRTIGYDLQYEWDYVNNRRIGRGYVARNTIEVRVDNVDRIGDYLEMAVGSGATSVGGIRWDLKDRAGLERDALRRAVADARGRAEALAGGLGRTLDRVIRVEELGAAAPRPMMREVQALAADAPVPPVSAGQIEIRAQVTLTATMK